VKAKTLPKLSNPKILAPIAIAVAITGATVFYAISQFDLMAQTEEPAPTKPIVRKITALGRLEPASETIRVAAPLSLDGDRVAQLLVKRGDRVEKGQVIAILDSRDRLDNALKQAQEQVGVAQAKLAQVKAGAKLGEIGAQKATVSRVQAQTTGDFAAQQATVSRIQAQFEGDVAAQKATIGRLEAQVEGDIAAQKATIQKLEAELNNAEAEYRRHQQLYQDGAISASLYDTKRMNVETSRQRLNEANVTLDKLERTGRRQIDEANVTLDKIQRTGREQIDEAKVTLNKLDRSGREEVVEAKATLDRIAEVRPVDVQTAQAEVNSAIAAVQKAKTDLEQTYIRAPIAGQILETYTLAGESISDDGIVELGQTDRMEVVAEVYQTDIGKIREDQPVIITGESLSDRLRGNVNLIGLQVSRQNVYSNEPGENLDRRVVEVRISLNPEDSKKVARLTNLQVQVTFQ
jgi:HlyD family secretion protein